MIYMQLKKYVLPNENDREKEIYKNFKHHFFPISDSVFITIEQPKLIRNIRV